MKKFSVILQKDSMECGAACVTMICRHYGLHVPSEYVSKLCHTGIDGVSLVSISHAFSKLGFDSLAVKSSIINLKNLPLPCILHWNQNHFVILYAIDSLKNIFWLADPGKGKYKMKLEDFKKHWISCPSDNIDKGIAMVVEPSEKIVNQFEYNKSNNSPFIIICKYFFQYKKYFSQIIIGLLLGCVLQLIMPFLTQWIVDIGIKHHDVGFIWLVLLGELIIVIGRTATDFIRRWLLLHISMRINITLVSDFFIKLLKLPMSFFDTKLMGDLLQRIGDHTRVQNFLTGQVLNIVFTFLSFIIFGIVLFIYNPLIFCIFAVGSVCYGLWIASFLKKRKVLDYELFEQQAINQNKTYQMITSMQEIKLQDCECRRRWEWEDTQADLFTVQMKSLKLQQSQEAGSIFINEIKNIIITVLAATAVINGQMTLGAMLAVQYIIGQLNSPVEQFMSFIYSLQDVKISLERINEIHEGKNEETIENKSKLFASERSIGIDNIDFKYDHHASIAKTWSVCVSHIAKTWSVCVSHIARTWRTSGNHMPKRWKRCGCRLREGSTVWPRPTRDWPRSSAMRWRPESLQEPGSTQGHSLTLIHRHWKC